MSDVAKMIAIQLNLFGEDTKKTGEEPAIPSYELERYLKLAEEAKRIEAEMSALRKMFHEQLDSTFGEGSKVDVVVDGIKLQRLQRESVSLDQSKTLMILKEKGLEECIDTVQVPNEAKIQASITLGMLAPVDLEGCLIKKIVPAIVVKTSE